MGWDGFRGALRRALGIVPTVDLHGLGVREALQVTERFVAAAAARREPCVRVVYGKGLRSAGGRGVLREVVPRWLDGKGAALVERYERRPDASGMDGSVLVWLRRDAAARRGAGAASAGLVDDPPRE
jgi:DNA-nicking Smr family endonuclease